MSSVDFLYSYDRLKQVHKTPFARFEDAGTYEFVDSKLYALLKQTDFKRVDSAGNIESMRCHVDNLEGLHFKQLKADYDYLWRWYHNPHRKSDTRHGYYIMLYCIDGIYQWKLSKDFFTKILTIPDNLGELFDFG